LIVVNSAERHAPGPDYKQGNEVQAVAAEWYYAKGQQKVGPLTNEQLRQLAASGQLRPTDMVWKQGMAKWTPAGQVKGLFHAAPGATGTASPPHAKEPASLPASPGDGPAESAAHGFRRRQLLPPEWQDRLKRHKWLILGVSGGLLLAIILLVVLIGGGPALTEDYDPFMPGTRRQYTQTFFNEDGSIKEKVKYHLVHKDDGAQHYWASDTPHRVHKDERRVQGDEVQYHVKLYGKSAWIPELKLGKRPGGTWEYTVADGVKVRWTYQKNVSERGKPCAVILEEIMKDGQVRETWLRWYVQGVGLVKAERRVLSGGSLKLTRTQVYD